MGRKNGSLPSVLTVIHASDGEGCHEAAAGGARSQGKTGEAPTSSGSWVSMGVGCCNRTCACIPEQTSVVTQDCAESDPLISDPQYGSEQDADSRPLTPYRPRRIPHLEKQGPPRLHSLQDQPRRSSDFWGPGWLLYPCDVTAVTRLRLMGREEMLAEWALRSRRWYVARGRWYGGDSGCVW